MNTVVKKTELLERVRANREQHRRVFEEAVDGYRAAAVAALEAKMIEISRGKLVSTTVRMPMPTDHTAEYDRVIDMFEMDTRDEIELDEYTFAQYVRDEWPWKGEFVASNSGYSASLAREAEQL